jgi:tRNA-specific 2-thiouridylase
LGIILHRVNFAREYRTQVFELALAEYRSGRTPNPDVLCNREIKFGVCLDYIARLGADWFATGHYAQRLTDEDGPVLARAADEAKDQSYFLHAVPRARLAQVLFPLGQLRKADVRELARRAGLRIHDKPDSTGICFIGERPFAQFLEKYLPATPGPIESADGRLLGTHRGLPFYTLGQRAGLALGGARGLPAEPWYVLAKRPERNALIVVQRHQQRDLEAGAVRVGELNWLCRRRTTPFRASVQLRYRQSPQSAWVLPLANGGAQLRFEQPQRAATPGQYAVLYEAQRCLGGGVIESVELLAAAPRANTVEPRAGCSP